MYNVYSNIRPQTKQQYFDAALQQGHADIVEALMSSSEVNISQTRAASILTSANTNGYTDIIRLLIDPAKRINIDPSRDNNAAIKTAVAYNRHNIIKLLLADSRVDPTVVSASQFQKELYRAIEDGRADIVELLITNGRTRVDPSYDNNRAIRLAVANNNADIIKLLIADIRVDPSSVDSSEMHQALYIMISEGRIDMVKLLLADSRTNIDLSKENNYALRAAVSRNQLDIFKLLLADSSTDPSDDNNKAIVDASSRGYTERACEASSACALLNY